MEHTATQTCTKCRVTKPLAGFNKKRQAKSGYSGCCRECQSDDSKVYRANRAEKLGKKSREYHQHNNAKIKLIRRRQIDEMRSVTTKQLDILLDRYTEDVNAVIEKIVLSYRIELQAFADQVLSDRRDRASADVIELRDRYVKNLLDKDDKIPRDMLPEPLIKLKREQIRLSRLIKEKPC